MVLFRLLFAPSDRVAIVAEGREPGKEDFGLELQVLSDTEQEQERRADLERLGIP